MVFGSSRARPGDADWCTAHELGIAIAAAGFTLANGGYGGTMAASSAGAFQAGGHTIGVTCDVFGRDGRNAHVAQEISTPDLMRRLTRMLELADAFVVLPGMTGTLVELAMAWEMVAKKLIRPRPIICLGEFWAPIVEQMVRGGAKTGDWLILAPNVQAVMFHLGAALSARRS